MISQLSAKYQIGAIHTADTMSIVQTQFGDTFNRCFRLCLGLTWPYYTRKPDTSANRDTGICERQFRADCFLSAKKCFLRQFGAYLFLRSVSICVHVSYLRRSVFYASLTRFSFCTYVDRICEYGIAFSGFFLCADLFFAYFSFMCRIVRIMSSRPHHILLY